MATLKPASNIISYLQDVEITQTRKKHKSSDNADKQDKGVRERTRSLTGSKRKSVSTFKFNLKQSLS